jgi:hypothetical protein
VAIHFHFASVEVCEMFAEELRGLDLDAFAVLMLLSRDGGTPAVLEEVLARLLKNRDRRTESIAVALFFANKVLTSPEDQRFIERKREMLQDTLRDSWLYQKVLGEGREEGREEGIFEQALNSIETVTRVRFPKLLASVKELIASFTDVAKLREVLSIVASAKSEEELKRALSDFQRPQEQHAER